MGFTVSINVDHLPTASVPMFTFPIDESRTILIPDLNPHGTVKSTLKDFIRKNLYIPDELQSITAPLFTRLNDNESVENIYSRYRCNAEAETPDLHVDEEKLIFFGREKVGQVELQDEDRLDERHITDGIKLQLKRLPQHLQEQGGRIFVETKDGILPILAVRPTTKVLEIKQTLEYMTGISVCQQLLYSVGRVMHDELLIQDFDGFQTAYEDSILDLCKSGDTNAEQAHRRMMVIVDFMGEQDFILVVQGKDLVQVVMQVVESRTGVRQSEQRIMFSGKMLQENRTLADYFIYPECTLHVSIFRSPLKPSARKAVNYLEEHNREPLDNAGWKPAARKLKLVRTNKGQVKGTLTIPVLTNDTLFDVKRKIKRTLQPLVERNSLMHTPAREQTHIDITPGSSAASGNFTSSFPLSYSSPSINGIKVSRSLSSQFTAKHLVGVTSSNNSAKKAGSPTSVCSSLQDQLASPSTIENPSLSSFRSGQYRQLQEFPPLSHVRPSQSVRRLQFEDGAYSQSPLSVPVHPSVDAKKSRELFHKSESENLNIDANPGGKETMDWLGMKNLGAWLSGSMQTLKEQIHVKFGDS